MPRPVVQRVRVGPVADGQVHADGRDLDGRHDPVAEIQQVLVLPVGFEPEIALDGAVLAGQFADDLRCGRETPVVCAGFGDHARVPFGRMVVLHRQRGGFGGTAGRAGLFHAKPRENAHAQQAAGDGDRDESTEHATRATGMQTAHTPSAPALRGAFALDDPIPVHNVHAFATIHSTNIGKNRESRCPGHHAASGRSGGWPAAGPPVICSRSLAVRHAVAVHTSREHDRGPDTHHEQTDTSRDKQRQANAARLGEVLMDPLPLRVQGDVLVLQRDL